MKYLNKDIENVALSAGADFVGFAKIEDGNLLSNIDVKKQLRGEKHRGVQWT